MKLTTIIFLLLIIPIQTTLSSDLLRCLGKEELRTHKNKDEWHNYKLNQEIVNEITRRSSMKFPSEMENSVCTSNNPTLTFVKLIVSINRQTYYSQFSKKEKLEFEELGRSVTEIFFRYIANIEALSPTSKCLDKKIPELSKLKARYMHLQAHYSSDKLFPQKELNAIFNKLIHVRKYYQECARKIKNQK